MNENNSKTPYCNEFRTAKNELSEKDVNFIENKIEQKTLLIIIVYKKPEDNKQIIETMN